MLNLKHVKDYRGLLQFFKGALYHFFKVGFFFWSLLTSITEVNRHLTLKRGENNLISNAFQCKKRVKSQDPGFLCISVLFILHKCRTEINDGSIDFAI